VTTQRAYTLRLRGGDPTDDSWREALWATHEAINEGAKAFGDWLLTLRGGLSHELANARLSVGKGKPDRDPTTEERRNRRVLLALSWLSVEDEHGAADGALGVATGRDEPAERCRKVVQALCTILRNRRVSASDIGDPAKKAEDQTGTWIGDCAPSLSAAIRDDAAWVDRSAAFEQLRSSLAGLDRKYAEQLVSTFFGQPHDYFKLPGIDDEAADSRYQEPEFRTLARQWVSTNFGTGQKSDTDQIVTALKQLGDVDVADLAGKPKHDVLSRLTEVITGVPDDSTEDALRSAIGWTTGRASKGRLAVQNLPNPPSLADLQTLLQKFSEEAREKEAKAGSRKVPDWMPSLQEKIEKGVGMPFVNQRNLIGEFSVMLDHAARRVSIAHSWIKRAEAKRQHFSEDARRLDDVPADAKQWLDDFCDARSGISGAATAYRIRRRAIEAWDRVVQRWSRTDCTTIDDRIAAARELQADPEIDKFGDIQLFEALAADDAKSVWQPNGKPSPDPLKDYVAAHDALDKQRRFKVPAYRHPDPLAHPVFGDFGNSRWNIRFAMHEVAKAAAKKSRNKNSDQDWLKDQRGLRMGLWNGQNVQPVDLRWSSKRLAADLALCDDQDDDQCDVARADRLGRAAAGLSFEQSARIAGLFELKDWNGRLQAPRVQLDAIAARVDKHGWDDTARRMRDKLNWLVTFSAKLECHGPFIEYAAAHGIQPNRKGEYYPNAEINKARKAHAELMLARLPGLRVLSVDLGHRFAAACAVWETLTAEDFEREIDGREVVAGVTSETALYLHTRHTDVQGKPRTTIYRRIGADKIVDPKTGEEIPHPAPWARLDRQFLIKLQGEEKPARAASRDESDYVRQLEADLGRVRDKHNPLPRPIDELMAEAVRSVRLALRHHGDAARIAYAFKPDGALHTPGGGSQEHTADSRKKAVRDALVRWHERATSTRWKDDWAAQQWDAHIKSRQTEALPEQAEEPTRFERKKQLQSLEDALDPLATTIAGDTSLLQQLHALWLDRWTDDDATWKSRLRRLRDWILPRGLRPRPDDTPQQAADRKARRGTARNVGGLSLTRIATIRELYQLQKAYAMRPAPDDPRKNIAAKDDHRYDEFGRSILRVVERLREQRVKQVASRIVEAALGVGRMTPTKGRDRKRPQERRDAPCHAVVIESLRNYRPDELQTRRENRALMNWSAGKVRKYLEEGCQLHGLHLREVMPNYTSRQCSRTGMPGLRCDDVPLSEFRTAPWWRRAVNAARKRIDEDGKNSYDRLLTDLNARYPTAFATPRRLRFACPAMAATCSSRQAPPTNRRPSRRT
jgi:IS605 OrfB family transposase